MSTVVRDVHFGDNRQIAVTFSTKGHFVMKMKKYNNQLRTLPAFFRLTIRHTMRLIVNKLLVTEPSVILTQYQYEIHIDYTSS